MFQKIKEFFKREPIVDVEEKRKAVERFCEAQHKICSKCWLWLKIPWYDECYYSDEEVDYSYRLIYGDTDPKEINEREV